MFEIWFYQICGPVLDDQLVRMELTMKEFNPQVSAVEALGALAHDTRLSVFRMLVKAGTEGLIAGAIAQAANVPPYTMSHPLGILEREGLVESERESDRKSVRSGKRGAVRVDTGWGGINKKK